MAKEKGILIIDIPENCVSCPVGTNAANSSGTVCRQLDAVITNSYSNQDKRYDSCPIIAVTRETKMRVENGNIYLD